MSHWLHEEASAELAEAAAWYARHASRVVAEAFLDEFARVVAGVELNQQLGTPHEGGMRSYPFRRFPYTLIYREDAVGPQVYAVAHQSRRPGYWSERP